MPSPAIAIGLALLTIALAVISGINDGGVLLSLATRYAIIPLGWFIGIVGVALVAGPVLLGVAVAQTLVSGLFAPQPGAELAFLIGAALALVVVWALTMLGLPTSVTLALVGGLSGAALGSGLTVEWDTIGRVLLIGLLAPTVSIVLARFVSRWLAMWGYGAKGDRAFRTLHVGAFTAQCLAYAVNDGQKMLAALAVTMAAVPAAPDLLGSDRRGLLAVSLAALTVPFLIGMLFSLRRITPRISRDLAVIRPIDAVTAEMVGAGAVFASSALGAPVSMSQSVAAAVVGSASSKGLRRVRWDSAARIAAAWIVTLPASGLLAALVGWVTR